ncbi:MAG: S49 family peptidase [Saprospiraceae bacterium]|nr:S49 family peptidase [Saprospiraceae bacterium]
MSEVVQSQNRTALEKALILLIGKELAIDPVFGLGYLSRFAHAIETNSQAFIKPITSEYITPNFSRIVETGNLYDMKDDKLSSLPKGSIVKLFLNDYMSVQGGLCQMGVQELANNLLFYRDNPNIEGAILEVNSGGGEAMAGQIMFNAIRDFKKPVVAYVHNAGSAAYMAIAGVKEIVASGELSRLGSIGALVSLDKKFLQQYKDRFDDIYSDLSSDKNSGFRSYIETGDSTGIKAMLNESVEAFQSLVESNRPIKKRDETLRGGMFHAIEAKKRGLADMIGSEDVAIKRLKVYLK